MAGQDYLHLGQNASILKLLCSNSSGNESVAFSDQVLKVNRRQAPQKRVLMITNRALYNIERVRCKRRIPVADISKVVCSKHSTASQGVQFVLKVSNDYDYQVRKPAPSPPSLPPSLRRDQRWEARADE